MSLNTFEPSLDDRMEKKGSVLKAYLKNLVAEAASGEGWQSADQS